MAALNPQGEVAARNARFAPSGRATGRPRRHAAYLASVLGSAEDPRPPMHLVWFAGGGGSSQGARQALGRDPDYALNHNADALRMHEVNHPGTAHLRADAFAASPLEIEPGRRIGSMWFSPDCTHHSKARGSAPKSKRIRGLAWCVIPWAKLRRPAVIFLENVEEFRDWGPLYPDDHPNAGQADHSRKGETFRRFIRRLEQCGYVVEWRELVAADHGAPTTRKRFFLIARCDGLPIVWPARTHAPRDQAKALGLKPWRGAHEIIDWSIPCPSIFLTPEEVKAQKLKIKRPLVAATRRRIARGIERYVINAAQPFIVPITHHGDSRVHGLADPLRTVTGAHRGEFAVSAPSFIRTDMQGAKYSGVGDPEEPLRTITGAGGFGVSAPMLIPHYGERAGQEPRCRTIDRPYPTVVPGQNGGQLAAAHLQRQFGTSTGSAMSDPVGTVMPDGCGKTALDVAYLTMFNENSLGREPDEPLHTVMAGATRHGVVAAHLSSYYATGVGSDAGEPIRTVTGEDRHGVVAAFMEQVNTGMVGHEMVRPLSTTVAKIGPQRLIETRLQAMGVEPGSRRRAVLDFLWEHFGEPSAEDWAAPLATRQSRLRFGLVVLAGPDGPTVWEIADVGMRMLVPRELFGAQGFPASYIIDRDIDGKPITGTAATLMCGNSVSPVQARMLYAANCEPEPEDDRVAA